MGIKNELDLLMGETEDKFKTAKAKTDKGMISFT
jgi:hypothetical protein